MVVPSWVTDAACEGTPLDLWFTEHAGRVKEAKRLCSRCPVRDECLELALSEDLPYGVFGGLTSRERDRARALVNGRGPRRHRARSS